MTLTELERLWNGLHAARAGLDHDEVELERLIALAKETKLTEHPDMAWIVERAKELRYH